MKLVNLTPHPIVLADGRTIESSGVARCEQTDKQVGEFAGLPIVETRYGAVTGIPDPQDGVMYVVSSIAAQACGGRQDVVVPACAIRDEKGRVVGCGALGRVIPGRAARLEQVVRKSLIKPDGSVFWAVCQDIDQGGVGHYLADALGCAWEGRPDAPPAPSVVHEFTVSAAAPAVPAAALTPEPTPEPSIFRRFLGRVEDALHGIY